MAERKMLVIVGTVLSAQDDAKLEGKDLPTLQFFAEELGAEGYGLGCNGTVKRRVKRFPSDDGSIVAVGVRVGMFPEPEETIGVFRAWKTELWSSVACRNSRDLSDMLVNHGIETVPASCEMVIFIPEPKR